MAHRISDSQRKFVQDSALSHYLHEPTSYKELRGLNKDDQIFFQEYNSQDVIRMTTEVFPQNISNLQLPLAASI